MPTKAGEPPDDDARYTVLDMPLHWQGVKLFDAELAESVMRGEAGTPLA